MDSATDYCLDDVSRHLAKKNSSPQLLRESIYTHMGLYLGWAIARGMTNQAFQNNYASELAAFHGEQLTGPQLVGRLRGVLRSSMFNDELDRFSRCYYCKAGRFYDDYIHTFIKPVVQAMSMYGVADTRENQNELSRVLDDRLRGWRDYPPAAQRIFGEEVGVGSFHDLETVTQSALLMAVRALKLTRICRPFVVFLPASDEVRVPQVLSYDEQNINVMTDEGVAAAAQCLREGLKLRTVKAFAAARLQQPDESGTPASGIEVIAQHFKSGPHRVVAPYTSDATGAVTFERPVRIPTAIPSPVLSWTSSASRMCRKLVSRLRSMMQSWKIYMTRQGPRMI